MFTLIERLSSKIDPIGCARLFPVSMAASILLFPSGHPRPRPLEFDQGIMKYD
jgi:hypothetical protein